MMYVEENDRKDLEEVQKMIPDFKIKFKKEMGIEYFSKELYKLDETQKMALATPVKEFSLQVIKVIRKQLKSIDTSTEKRYIQMIKDSFYSAKQTNNFEYKSFSQFTYDSYCHYFQLIFLISSFGTEFIEVCSIFEINIAMSNKVNRLEIELKKIKNLYVIKQKSGMSLTSEASEGCIEINITAKFNQNIPMNFLTKENLNEFESLRLHLNQILYKDMGLTNICNIPISHCYCIISQVKNPYNNQCQNCPNEKKEKIQKIYFTEKFHDCHVYLCYTCFQKVTASNNPLICFACQKFYVNFFEMKKYWSYYQRVNF